MEVDATLDDDQTKTSAWAVTDVTPAMEGIKKPLLVGFWNPDALVTNGANNVRSGAPDFKLDHPSGVRILHRVVQQIRENVPQQAPVGLHYGRRFSYYEFDRTSPVSCGKDFVH